MFAMLSVCLLGLAALVIDMGFVRLARQQMQTAADAAALEGLRWQGVQNTSQLPPAWSSDPNYAAEVGLSGSMSLTATQSDQVRRWAASQVVADGPFGAGTQSQPSMFAEYYDTASGTVNYGAGPIVNFSSGIGDPSLAAAQTTTLPYPPVYQPVRNDGNPGLELNLSNKPEGDMVAGTYGFNSGFNGALTSDEDDAYNRLDFVPATASASPTAPAFLVRMRRTNNNFGLDSEPGVSSGTATLPFLFGRGSLIGRSSTPGQLSAGSGVTVRATAIAAVGPVSFTASGGSQAYIAGLAKTVGTVDPSGSYAGHVPFAINVDVWAGLVANGGTLTASGGTLTITGGTSGGPRDGLVLAAAASGSGLTATSVAGIGQAVVAGSDSSTLAAYPASLPAYIPIYTTTELGGQQYTIIGFGYLPPGSLTVGAAQIIIAPSGGASAAYPIAVRNASGVVALPVLGSFSAQDVSTLFTLHEGLTSAVYTPVLVDHYIGPNAP